MGPGLPSRRVCLVALGLLVSLGATAALAESIRPARHSAELPAPLTVRAQPPSRTVAPGAAARYAVRVARAPADSGGLSGRTRLSVANASLPTGTSVSFGPQRGIAGIGTSHRTTNVTVTTAAATPPGTYELQIRAQRPHRRGRAAITLTVLAPVNELPAPVPPEVPLSPTPGSGSPPVGPVTAPDAFTIAGEVPAALTPGSGEPLDLTLTNLESKDLSITDLTVTVTSVGGPRSSPTLPCGDRDFSVQQFSGTVGFTLPAGETTSLSALGFAPAQWPQVAMRNLPLNQNGCQGASLVLSFSGSANEETR
jgi:hypothetical protein